MRMKRYPRRIDYCIIVIEFLFDTVRNAMVDIISESLSSFSWLIILRGSFYILFFYQFFWYVFMVIFRCSFALFQFFFFHFLLCISVVWFQLQPNIFLYVVDSKSSASVCIHVKCIIVNDTLHESAFDIINSPSTILWIIFLLLVFWKDNNLFHVLRNFKLKYTVRCWTLCGKWRIRKKYFSLSLVILIGIVKF